MKQVECIICVGGIALEFNDRFTDIGIAINALSCGYNNTALVKKVKFCIVTLSNLIKEIISVFCICL